MKKLLWFGFLFSLFFVQTTFAAYNLTASTTETSLTATMTGAKGSTSSFELFVLDKPFPIGEYTPAVKNTMTSWVPGDRTKNVDAAGAITWTVPALPQTTYYIRVVEHPAFSSTTTPKPSLYATEGKTVITNAATITASTITVDYNTDTGGALIKGTIDKAKNPSFIKYDITLQYSKEAIADAVKYPVDIAADGTFQLLITGGLTPSTKYNLRETIMFGKSKLETDGSFNSATGYVPTNTQTVQQDLEDRSYRLLAPFPGLSVFLDPDICAERMAAGAAGELCDINDFLNLGFKILIGAAAVLLVLRIMFEGYKYITTDIPALKTNAKSGLKDALLGLLLALSSFLILNTINPKLVENTINTDRLEIAVEITGDGAAPFSYGKQGQGLASAVYCPGSGGKSVIPKIAESFIGNVVYSQKNRNSLRSDGKQSLDCSSYTAQVLNCAGYTIPGVSTGNVTTATLKPMSEKINSTTKNTAGEIVINGIPAQIGDLLGWRTGDVGHVVMYLGKGKIIEVRGGEGDTGNAAESSGMFDYYQKKYGFQFIYRVK